MLSPFWDTIYLNLKALEFFKKDTVKQPSASVKPVNQLLFKLGKISLFFNSTGLNVCIFPLIAFLLKLSKKSLKFFFLVGNIKLPLNNKIIKYFENNYEWIKYVKDLRIYYSWWKL